MKRFEFSLERLLKVKRQLEQMADLEQARAARVVTEARVRVEGLKSRLEEVSTAIGRGPMPGHWASVYALSEQLGQEIDRAEQSAREAESVWAVLARRKSAASTEVEVLASLRDQRLAEWEQESASRIQEQLDEVSLRRWMKDRGLSDEGMVTP